MVAALDRIFEQESVLVRVEGYPKSSLGGVPLIQLERGFFFSFMCVLSIVFLCPYTPVGGVEEVFCVWGIVSRIVACVGCVLHCEKHFREILCGSKDLLANVVGLLA